MKGPRQVKSPGRPSQLTEEASAKICEGVRGGLTYELAAWRAGVSYETVRRWRAKGMDDIEAGNDTAEARFCAAIKSADAECAWSCATDVMTADKDTAWTARAWMLERRFGYVRTERQEVVADVRAKVSTLTDEELEAEVRGALGDADGHDPG